MQTNKDQDADKVSSVKSNKTFTKKNSLDDYNYNPSALNLPMYKTSKRMKFADINDDSYHGIATLPSDNIRNIVRHDFEKSYLNERIKRKQELLAKIQNKKENIRSQETKASIMRNQAIKERIDNKDKEQSRFKLKLTDESKPASVLSETTKEIRRNYKEQLKSNIETESVLKIAEMNKLNTLENNDKKDEPKEMYIGEEIQKLKDLGTHIYSFDIKQNKIPSRFSQNPHSKYKQIGSRMRIRRNPGKI